MQVLYTIFYILLFLVFLSILITIHELGHLIAAKIFKVYCFEFSIGFGPKLFSLRRKGGETYFSLRALPFGGFVSMYGEEDAKPENAPEIPRERSLLAIKKWKRAIVLLAGVTMNAVLALSFFFVSEVAFPQNDLYANYITVADDSIAAAAGLKTQDKIQLTDTSVSHIYSIDEVATLTYLDGEETKTKDVSVTLDGSQVTDLNNLGWGNFVRVFENKDGKINLVKTSEIFPSAINTNVSFKLTTMIYNETTKEDEVGSVYTLSLETTQDSGGEYMFKDLGLSIFKHRYYNGFGRAVKKTFVDFGNSSTAIIRSFGALFVSQEARESAGSIIAIGFETSNILKNFGFGQFLKVWGLISVNLAIINLLPFPSLDGWQLLVLIVEAVAHREIPKKVKSIVSIVGFALLLGLVILLMVKDVFTYIL